MTMNQPVTRWQGLCVRVFVGVLVAFLAPFAAGADVSFDVTVTRAEVGRTRVVAFHSPAAEADREFEASVGDGRLLEVVDKPAVLAGYTNGFLRVRGLKAGVTTLVVGGAKVKVEVVAPRVPDRGPAVQIVEPVSGAVAWGKFAVGVEVDQSGIRDPGPPDVQLELSSGQKLEPVGTTSLAMGPVRHLTFEVNAEDLPAGPVSMWVSGGDASDADATRVRVKVIKPGDDAVTKVEAEEPFTGERPERFKRPRLTVQNDGNASGGKFVNNAASDPAMCIGFHVDQTGWYQAFITAGADFGGGAYPTVGLIVDGAQYPVTNGRVCASAWHRLALGVPVKLEAGDRVLTPYFLNDFSAGRLSDRNLRLDYVELVRVEGPSGAPSAGGGMMGEQAMAPAPMDSMMAGGGGEGPDDPMGVAGGSPVRIGLNRVLDGQLIAGDLTVDGYCWFEGIEANPPVSPPRVTLLINGEAVADQWSASPRFEVAAGSFKNGKNTVQLTARSASGATAKTPVQTMTYARPGDAPKAAARVFERFTVFDPRWDGDVRARIQREQGTRERAAAAFASNGEATLHLPDDLEGSYDLSLEMRGENFKGSAVAIVRLKQGDGEAMVVKEVAALGRWDTRKAGTVELQRGAKQVSVAFENDLYEEGKGDRNLYLQSVILQPVVSDADQTPPLVAITYPASGAACYMADAVVATASDNRGLSWAELEIDDKPTGIRVEPARGGGLGGRLVFPLALRSVTPGKHSLTVRASDAAKNASVSRAVSIKVLGAPPTALSKYDRAVRLLDRFGFGPDQDSLAAVLTLGEAQWLSDELARPLDDTAEMTSFASALARFPNTRGGGDVQRRALLHALTTPNPARGRFVLWAENHFSTWIRKTEGPRKWAEHVEFERLGAAPFGDLLEASSRSPAMLRYLDQENSYATRLNENYAREIMELHCLGVHGGYTQQDVTSLAHLLTGWTVSREGDGRSGGEMSQYNFRFDPALNDRAEIKVVGVNFGAAEKAGAYDRIERVLEVLAAHPSTAQFVSRKLADHYLGCPAPDSVVNDLARVFQEAGGDMRELLMALARHPAFWASETGAPKGSFPAQRMAHPQDFAIRLSRVARHINPGQAADFLSRTGQNLFDRATPDGYSELDSDYTDSNAMIQRWRLAQDFGNDLAALVPEAMKKEPDAKAAPDEGWGQRVVDVLAIRLTGRVLSATSNEVALKMLGEIEGKRVERIQKFAPLMAQLPEAHLR
jgi:uncharacterized protein (DUF1800 family)